MIHLTQDYMIEHCQWPKMKYYKDYVIVLLYVSSQKNTTNRNNLNQIKLTSSSDLGKIPGVEVIFISLCITSSIWQTSLNIPNSSLMMGFKHWTKVQYLARFSVITFLTELRSFSWRLRYWWLRSREQFSISLWTLGSAIVVDPLFSLSLFLREMDPCVVIFFRSRVTCSDFFLMFVFSFLYSKTYD